MKKIEKEIELGGKTLKLSTGHIAGQASGAVMAQYGETVVMATVVGAPLKIDLGYFPLSVEYQERLYAGGKIKGSRWIKREGRPTDEEILTARLIDRSIRPLFPKEYKKEVQVITTVMSVDLENSPEVLAGVAASAAIAISEIPWEGPVAIVQVGMKDDSFILNPTTIELEESKMDLVVSSTKDAVVMIEAGIKEVPEEKVLDAIDFAQKESQKINKLIADFAKDAGKEKEAIVKEKVDADFTKSVKDKSKGAISDLIKKMSTKEAGYGDLDLAKNAVAAEFENATEKAQAASTFEYLFKEEIRKMLLSGKRPDGRKTDQIRPLSAEVSILPRTHGSGLFQRGATQVLSIATLGANSLGQLLETAEGEETKRYMHHYSMPPYSTGETGKVGSPNRREIGHGALAERALVPVLPSEDEFPYTIRVVSEVLSSNGSTSMASTCGSTLSLMDAGVPIKSPVAGIAMGLVVEDEKKFTVLTDIVGLEDGNGDMDFKVAGTKDGVTALQLDVKTLKLTVNILKTAFEQAKEARMKILEVMLKAIPEPRKQVSAYAPKIKLVRIDPEKIGELIGPGGRTIKKIIAETGAMVDVEDDGQVNITGATEEALNAAVAKVEALTKEVKAGEIYEGEVKRLQNFGAFVEILPGKDGLVHVSDMAREYVKDPASIVAIGDKVTVRVKEIDELGRINLSMLLDPAMDEEKRKERQENYQRRSQDRDSRGRGGQRGEGGPHFPMSRFIEDNPRRSSGSRGRTGRKFGR